MSPFTCPREREVTDLLHRGHWPQASPAELRCHVEECRRCSELVAVTQTLQAARTQSLAAAHLPTSGSLWWRAQLRRRNQAIERISRPIFGAQVFAGAAVCLIAVCFLAWEFRRGFRLLDWVAALPQSLHLDALLPAELPHMQGASWLLLPVLASLLLVGGVVAYFASEKQ